MTGTLTIVGLADDFRFLTLIHSLMISFKFSYADNHDTENNIIEKAKEINQKVKEKQALQSHIKSRRTLP